MKIRQLYIAVTLVFLHQFILVNSSYANDEGRSVYISICSACHAPENVMVSSPKAGDVAEWKRRLAKGIEATTDNAVNGFSAMPPKGGVSSLSREQIRLAIQYMAEPNQ